MLFSMAKKKFSKFLLNCIEISISKTKEKSRLKGRCQIWFIRMIDKTAEPVAVKAWKTRGQVLFNFFGCFWRYFKLLGFLVGFTKYIEARSSTLSINDCEFLFLNKSKGTEAWSRRLAEAVVRMCCVERVFLEFCRIPRKTSVLESLFYRTRPATSLEKRLWHRRFPVNFAKFLRTPFLQNTSGGCFWPENM